MPTIHCSYGGDLHCIARHQQSGVEIQTDAPTDHDGRGESFSPTDLLATALGTCVLTIMGITARRRGWDLGDAKANVEKVMTTHPPRRIETLRVDITLPTNLTKEQRKLLQRVAQDCPVKRNLDSTINIELNWA
ncbi:OsmC family protein [Parasynechococcus sp.]|uniref:OsmC family protein n=1 Tax=Parasynechococcus sp. TaxID=3101203 RepID=UPI0037047A9B